MENSVLKPENTYRLEYFDIAKGIGMLCIIAGHMGIGIVNSIVFTFHVPLFFLISGYFLSKKTSLKDFTVKKAKTLLVPYVFTSVCLVLMKIPVNIVKGTPENAFSDMLDTLAQTLYGSGDKLNKTLFSVGPIGAIWFLVALFFAVVIVKISLNMKHGVWFVLVIAVASYASSKYVWLPLSVQAGGASSVFVYIGAVAKEKKLMDKTNQLAYILGIAFLVFEYCMKIRIYAVSNNFQSGLLSVIGAVFISYSVISASRLVEKTHFIKKILIFFGKYSLPVLCFHLIELNNAPWYIVYNLLGNTPEALKHLCVFLCKLLFVTACTFAVLKINWLRRIFGYPTLNKNKIN